LKQLFITGQSFEKEKGGRKKKAEKRNGSEWLSGLLFARAISFTLGKFSIPARVGVWEARGGKGDPSR